MKKLLTMILVLGMTAGMLAACSSEETESEEPADAQGETEDSSDADISGELTIFTWEGMFPQEILDGFEEEYGVKINYATFDYDEVMYEKLAAADGGDYDLVIADDYIIETVIEAGLAQKLDKSKLTNWDNINPAYQGQFYDETDEYTVPHGAGVMTLMYNPALTDVEINGYEDLWNEELKDNIGIIGNHRVVNGMAQKILGYSYNTDDADEIEEAGELLLDLAPNIRLIKDDSLENDLLSGEVAAAVMYTSQVTMAKLTDPELEIVYPEEGIGFGIMAGFIPSQAPNADAAHEFLNYLLRDDIAAAAFEWLGYYSTNQAADELIADEYKEFLTLPEDFDTDSMEMIGNVSADSEELHTKIWTEFKTAAGQE